MGFRPVNGAVGTATASQVLAGATFSSAAAGIGITGTEAGVQGTAVASDVLSGVTFSSASAGSDVTGTMPQVGTQTVTPGTATQTVLAAGNYASGDQDVAGDTNLVPGNIISGKSIFGVAGSALQGKTGSVTGSGTTSFTVSGLPFTPSHVKVYCDIKFSTTTYPSLIDTDVSTTAVALSTIATYPTITVSYAVGGFTITLETNYLFSNAFQNIWMATE